MFFVTGASRSGKTSTLAALVKLEPQWAHVIASSILRDIGRPLINLDMTSAWENQLALANELRHRGLLHSRSVILDGHAVIELEAKPFLIQDQAFDDLAPSGIATVHEVKERIIERRRVAGKPEMTEERLDLIQDLEIEHSRAQAIRLGIPFLLVKSGDVQSLSNWLQDFTRETEASKIH